MLSQKKIPLKYAKDTGFPNPLFFIDDGVSGVIFDRPGWNEMIGLAEAGKVKTVIVKDMSRMVRDYLKVGYYTESFLRNATYGIPQLMTAWTATRATTTSPLFAICSRTQVVSVGYGKVQGIQ